MEDGTVSVILPAFNGSRGLGRPRASVREQSLQPKETFVHAGSTDGGYRRLGGCGSPATPGRGVAGGQPRGPEVLGVVGLLRVLEMGAFIRMT